MKQALIDGGVKIEDIEKVMRETSKFDRQYIRKTADRRTVLQERRMKEEGVTEEETRAVSISLSFARMEPLKKN